MSDNLFASGSQLELRFIEFVHRFRRNEHRNEDADRCGVWVDGHGVSRDTRCAMCREADDLLQEWINRPQMPHHGSV